MRRQNCLAFLESRDPQRFAFFLALTIAMGLAARVTLADSVETWGDSRSNIPVVVSGLSSGITLIATGGSHSLALKDGGVFAWGNNSNGQVGNGSTKLVQTPVAIGNLSSGITAIAGGWNHSLAIQNGGVYAWGFNTTGQLGIGNNTDSHVPVAIGTLSSNVTAIAGGALHSLAIQNGGVFAWGSNSDGRLGDGTTANSNSPVAINALSSGVTAIAVGDSHSLAIKDGGLFAWGYNGDGQLGIGSSTYGTTPLEITSLSSGVTSIAAGTIHSLAVQNGNVFAWGDNFSGELGTGTTTGSNTPVQIDPTDLKNIVSVAAGAQSSYALSSDGSLWVWGSNSVGQLGLGTATTQYLTPQHLLATGGLKFTSIDADADGTLVIASLATAPEPSSLFVLSIASAGLLRRRGGKLVRQFTPSTE